MNKENNQKDKSQDKNSTRKQPIEHILTDKYFQQCLSVFEFTRPLPEKRQGTLRVFYNNCNGLEINNTIGVFLKQKRDKKNIII